MSHFLSQLLPTQGLYCSAQAASKGFIHRYFSTIENLVNHLETQDAAGHTMYVAQATYKTTESRKTDNASHVRNFFLDIDAGTEKYEQTPDKAYPSQREALDAVGEVTGETTADDVLDRIFSSFCIGK